MHSSLKALFLFFLFFVMLLKIGAADIIKINKEIKKINIVPYSEIFIDTQNHFLYDDVSKSTFSDNFKPSDSKSISAGGTKESTIWFKFNILNENSEHSLIKLELPIVWLNKKEVYFKTKASDESQEFETLKLSQAHNINPRSFFIPLHMKPMQSATVFIKAHNTSAMTFAPKIYSKDAAELRTMYIAMTNGALMAVVIFMLLYTLSNYITLRNKNYLNYLFYLAGVLFLVGTYYGYNIQFLVNNNYAFSENLYYPIVAFNFLTALLLSRSFLKIDTQFAKVDKLIFISVGLYFALGLFGFIFGNGVATAYGTLVFALLNFLFLLFISALGIKNRILGSFYFLLAWVFLSVGNFLLIGMILGFMRYNDYVYDIYAILLVLNILMISFAMVSRIKDEEIKHGHEIKKEHEAVNKLSLSKKELLKLNEKLQKKILKQEKELLAKSREHDESLTKDDVTKLYNRAKLEELLANELYRAKRYEYKFSLIIANIDNMGEINKKHGYEVGNSVIKEMSDLFMKHIRYLDTVGRWSENEYIIICPQTNAKEAFTAAEHLQSFVEKNKFFFVGKVTSSFGVTDSHADDSLQEMIKRAYEALDKAKKGGKNRVEMAALSSTEDGKNRTQTA